MYEDLSQVVHLMKNSWQAPDDPDKVIPTYQVLNDKGKIVKADEYPSELTKDRVLKLFHGMIQIHEMDKILYEIQRQGLISFYMTAFGEEAIHFGSSEALKMEDIIYAQYREVGVIYNRGFTVNDIVNQCFSNAKDLGKGRQMPVHYGSKALNFHTISSPLGTQIPQASGAGYALKVRGLPNVAVCYFGDGAASEGDFHPALNFASTLNCPTVFICRNNKWAISTPSSEQYRGDGIAGRGVAYGMHTIRVDGNDLFAVYNATKEARRIGVELSRPTLIETMTYRVGHHSTSDDYTRYRDQSEVNTWTKGNNPITRLQMFLEDSGWITEQEVAEMKKECKAKVIEAMKAAEKEKKPHVDHLFSDVYDTLPPHLLEQREELRAHLKKYGEHYHLDSYSGEY